jgi:hypothetical protein
MSAEAVLVVFLGGVGGSPMEDMVAAARRAATFDTIETAQRAGIDRAIVLTDDPALQSDVAGVEVVTDVSEHHFGRALAGLVREKSLRSVIYLGGGSVPLIGMGDFTEIATRLQVSRAVTNNRFSSDLIAWNSDAAGLSVVEGVSRDNSLARALQESGVEMTELPRTVETIMDIDSPCDLAVLAVTGRGGPRLRSVVADVLLDLEPYRQALRHFVHRTSEIMVAGRVGSYAWQYMERETACRVRIFAEERGLEADGRGEMGQARSLVGYFLEAAGTERFFEAIAEMGDVAFIDTRVLLAHNGVAARRTDRFLSDARMPDEVGEPFLREFTRAAVQAPIPVLLGGHSLVSGGLMALNDYAWAQHEAGLLPHG